MADHPINVLVIGGGGREHALCWSLRKSPGLAKLYCAPGNGGIAEVAECVALATDAAKDVVPFCRKHGIGLVVVGPEAPLVAGLVDDLEKEGIPAFGPSKAAAQLEGSKAFTKALCGQAGIPTAAYKTFEHAEGAKDYLRKTGAPMVVKADGLAAGKGVIIADTVEVGIAAIDEMFGGKFGAAGMRVVLEEKLEGEEASFLCLVDGKHLVPLASAQDHKRAFDGDKGPNTGGMGAYSPAPVLTAEMRERVMDKVMRPAVTAMAKAGTPYKGVLYAGLMIAKDGPKLIEFNCRFGDPECQVIVMRLQSDLLPALLASAKGTLDQISLEWRKEVALTVVMAANGYPGPYEKGSEIKGLEKAKGPGVEVFHAGTRREGGKILAAGGRVLNVTALGATVAEARDLAYRAVDAIDWPQGFCRRDIGHRALSRRPA
jgi:phosphoribosylamine---glycine ligase